MQYEFITDLGEKEYNDLITEDGFIHYKSDKLWDKLNNINKVMYVGLKLKKKYLGCAKIEIYNHYLNISNISMFKKDDVTLSLFLNEIYRFAKRIKIYKIHILDVDLKENPINKKTNKINKYYLLKLQDKNKFIRKDNFKRTFNSDDTNILSIKTKLTKQDINNLKDTINSWNIKLDFNIEELINTYKTKCVINLEILDLVYYLNQSQSQNNPHMSRTTIEELIDTYGEEMIVGFSITLFPTNKKAAYCLTMNTIDAFSDLNIKDNLILETISTALKKKYHNLIFFNEIKKTKEIFEFNYDVTLNAFKYFISKLRR